MQSPLLSYVNYSGLLRTINAALVKKETACAWSVLKNDLKVNRRVEFVHTWFQAFSDLVAFQTYVGKQNNDIFLRNCRHGVVMPMSVFVQNAIDKMADYALSVAVLRKEFSNLGSLKADCSKETDEQRR